MSEQTFVMKWRCRYFERALVCFLGAWWVAVSPLPGLTNTADAGDGPKIDVVKLFEKARETGRTGLARKTAPVDVRPARPGEVVVTVIAGEGKETQSPPADPGDMVVRNRCPETGNEEILLRAKKFAARYRGPLGAGSRPGWQTYRPRGNEMAYFIVPSAQGRFTFVAPWGEMMKARPGDAIVQVPGTPKDTYRIAAAAFACTYEIIRPARK